MPLSRLENFLKNIQGNVIYVDPNELDATDSIENQGNSQTRPFKTIQRALIEAARFSYFVGHRNDKIDLTTRILAAGTHTVVYQLRGLWLLNQTYHFFDLQHKRT